MLYSSLILYTFQGFRVGLNLIIAIALHYIPEVIDSTVAFGWNREWVWKLSSNPFPRPPLPSPLYRFWWELVKLPFPISINYQNGNMGLDTSHPFMPTRPQYIVHWHLRYIILYYGEFIQLITYGKLVYFFSQHS